MKRAIVIVLDGCGAGAAPDAAKFGDGPEVATVRNVIETVGGIHAPHLERTGYLAACGVGTANARYGRLLPLSQGKDSVTGHWEMMGIQVDQPFPTYPNGFPDEVIREFERRSGVTVIGNKAASGTAIIAELGPEHLATGQPILYTSADSVFQIATHEAVVPIERLYELCVIARDMLVAPHNVQRVIARPFDGEVGAFRRTERRKDFPLVAPPNLLDEIGDVLGIGVVPELFGGRGFRSTRRTQSNPEHEAALLPALEAADARFIFTNFEDFDMLFGHRNDPAGFARCLEAFDITLGKVLERLTEEDLLILTADHGNDPTDASTDHSREYVPYALIGGSGRGRRDADGMASIGRSVAEHLGVDWAFGSDLRR